MESWCISLTQNVIYSRQFSKGDDEEFSLFTLQSKGAGSGGCQLGFIVCNPGKDGRYKMQSLWPSRWKVGIMKFSESMKFLNMIPGRTLLRQVNLYELLIKKSKTALFTYRQIMDK